MMVSISTEPLPIFWKLFAFEGAQITENSQLGEFLSYTFENLLFESSFEVENDEGIEFLGLVSPGVDIFCSEAGIQSLDFQDSQLGRFLNYEI